MTLGKYLKSAFLNRWNLLLFGGASAFAFLTGHPEFFFPLVLAGELAYVGMIGTHPKYQRYVDAQEAKATRVDSSQTSEQTLQQIVTSLPQASLQRFEALRSRCLELRQLSMALKDPAQGNSPPPLESLQLQGLDFVSIQLDLRQPPPRSSVLSLEFLCLQPEEAMLLGLLQQQQLSSLKGLLLLVRPLVQDAQLVIAVD